MKRKAIFAALLACTMMLNAQTKEPAVVFYGGSSSMDESYLVSGTVSVSFDSDGNGVIKVGDVQKGSFAINNETPVVADFRDAFTITANQDLKNTSDYYSTFYSEKNAYKVPVSDVTAYAGEVDGSKLKLTSVGSFIHKGEPVLLKGASSQYTLMPMANGDEATEKNSLEGTEEGKTNCEPNVYALSYGQAGVGFYKWAGKDIAANKAYLIYTASAKALSFEFNGEPSGIESISDNANINASMYNLKGMKVDKNYKGIVVNKGKKYIVK
ncbi:MAG: hypothetical protein MJZ08_04730 [Bacteroidaceae bacterium]|nr:hypothetical protein [Bacteroidaceae bacterium]